MATKISADAINVWLCSTSNKCENILLFFVFGIGIWYVSVKNYFNNTLHNSSISFATDHSAATLTWAGSQVPPSLWSASFPKSKARLGWTAVWVHTVWFCWLYRANGGWKWCAVMGWSTAPAQADDHQAEWWLLLIQYRKCFHGGPPSRRDHTKTQLHRWSVELTPVFKSALEQWFWAHMSV